MGASVNRDRYKREKPLHTIISLILFVTIFILIIGLVSFSLDENTTIEDIDNELALQDMVDQISQANAEGLVSIGIIIIIATPLITILISATIFLREGDRFLAIIALLILAIIAFGFLQGSL